MVRQSAQAAGRGAKRWSNSGEVAAPGESGVREFLRRFHQRHGGWSLAAAILLAGFYLATSIQIASHRLFWFDELFTISISRLPNLPAMLQALKADNNMPLPYFVVVHLFERLLGHSEMAARLPSALAMTAGLLIAFDCARRLTDGLHGLIAIAFLVCTFLPYFGYEARSYGIYFMFAALAFWIWSNTSDQKLSSAVLFGAVFLLGVSFHYYFVLCIVPYALWEAARWRPWRLPSWEKIAHNGLAGRGRVRRAFYSLAAASGGLCAPKLVGGALGIGCAIALLSGQILGANRHSATFWSKPSLFALRETFSAIFPDAAFLLALMMVLFAGVLASKEKIIPLAPMTPAETAGWLCLAIPLAGFVLAKLVTNAFVDRYFIGMLPGVGIAFACSIWRHFREGGPGAPGYNGARWVPMGAFLLLAGAGIHRQMEVLRNPESIDPFNQQTQTRAMMRLENDLRKDGKRFFLFSTGMLYFPSHFYSPHPESYVLLISSEKDLETSNTLRYVYALRRFYPTEAWNLEDLRQHAQETALIEPSAADLAMLANAGFQTRIPYAQPLRIAYLGF
ncbi:MAG TPA: glycosyltransferase family 39 protein [Bryobacteraceae bacterium]